MTVDDLSKQLAGKTVLQVERLPYVLVRWDWLETTLRWLAWCQSQMVPEKLDISKVGEEQMAAFVERCFAELEELQRIGKAVTMGSPLVYMRSAPLREGLPEEVQLAMPPRDPNERGN